MDWFFLKGTLQPTPLGLMAAAYLLGSIPFGYLIVRFTAGRDVRSAGSGNIGATNVGRVAGKRAGIFTLILDAAKGWLAVWLAMRCAQGDVTWMMGAAVMVVVGHMFPLWLIFRGGKGVATAAGAFLPICAAAVGGGLFVFAVVVAVWRYVSLGSIVAAAFLPLMVYRLYAVQPAPWQISAGGLLISALILVKHHENIRRLIAGTENRLGKTSEGGQRGEGSQGGG